MEFAEYLIGRRLSRKTVACYVRIIERCEDWARSAATDLCDLKPSEVVAMASTFAFSYSTQTQLRCALRHYWEHRGVAGHLAAILVPAPPPPIWRGVPDAVATQLLGAARIEPWPYGVPIMCGIYAGMRRSEIAMLRWRSFDKRMEVVTIVGKGAKTRRIPVHPGLRSYLKPHRASHGDYILPGRFGGHVNPATVGVWTLRLADKAGLGELTPHQLRHVFAGKLYRATRGSTRATQYGLGHAKPQTTERYLPGPWEEVVQGVVDFDFEWPTSAERAA